MSQIDILNLIIKEPGIEQQYIHTKIDIGKKDVSDQVLRLVRKHQIMRVPTKKSWKLYPQ